MIDFDIMLKALRSHYGKNLYSPQFSVHFSEFLLFKLRQCGHHSERSKSYLHPLTFVKLGCLLKLEYLDIVLSTFSSIKYFDFVCRRFH